MPPKLLRGLYAAIIAAALVSVPVAAHAMGDEEFVGPFPSWANVKTNYGAAGDGVTDDTTAIQNALNALGSSNPTLYFPAGTYRITQTLTLTSQIYVNIIGQDPANTTIIWDGSSGGTMLVLTGIANSRFNRLTFNGQNNAAILVDEDWPGTGNYFDTGNEYADNVFENSTLMAFRCGHTQGCADIAILRDKFINNNAGVWLGNYNALDVNIWYSLFQNNVVGVGNWVPGYLGAGNFHVYNSIFQGSTEMDVAYALPGVFNFRNNYSIGSQHFTRSGGSCSSNNVTIQGNTILDTTAPISIYQGDLGPVVLLDNIVRSASGVTTGPVVHVGGCSGDLFSMGNTFTATDPTQLRSPGHIHSIQDQVVERSSINPTMPTLPGTPPNNNRQIFEVTPGSTAAQIQQVINQAAASGTVKPVVHIQPGSYSINTTLVVPAGSDMQIIGDGYYSRLTWSGTTTGPVMRLQGPSKAILRDFSVNGNNNSADGIEVDNTDQAGSRVFMEQAMLGQSSKNLFVDALDYTHVELHDPTHTATILIPGVTTSIYVTGGAQAATGNWQGGVTTIFGGGSGDNYYSYGVSNGAHVAVAGQWHDTGASGGAFVANITGASSFTYTGSYMAQFPSNPTAIVLNNFQGTAALVNLYTTADINITGNGDTARVLGLGLVGPSDQFFSNTSSPASTTEFLNGIQDPEPGIASPTQLPEQGCCDTTFLTAALNQLRTEQPTLLAPLANGVTDARFYRVFVGNARAGIHLIGAPVNPRAGGPLPGLTPAQIDEFNIAKDVFAEVEDVPGGLGPRFNMESCGGCHSHPAIGGSSPAVNPQVAVATAAGATNTVPSFITDSGPVREARFVSDGRVHDFYTIAGRSDAPGCVLAQPDFTGETVIFRIPTPLFGAGLVENTSDATLMTNAAFVAQRRGALGVSGHFNHIGETIGKFGWKAQHKSLREFSGEAYVIEMGVTNELAPVELDLTAGCQFNAVPESIGDIDQFALFMQRLAPPAPAAPTPTIERGKFVFNASGCNMCHIERQKTATNITYSPFSDFQLHRMGSLADGIQQGEAIGEEFRTAPLWGVGQRLFFLHDGRTSVLMDAVQAHASPGSEASASIGLLNAFSADDKAALIKFLESL